MFDISIIIVTYNSADVIEKCISSLKKEIKSFYVELIVVDNNSRDDTLAIIENFCRSNQKNLTIKIIENPKNNGFTKGLNQGLGIASGEFIMIMNPDIFIINGFFEKSINFLKENQDVGLIAPQHLSLKNDVIPSCRGFPDHIILLWEIIRFSRVFKKSRLFGKWRMEYFDHKSSKEVDQPMGSCLIGRKEVIDKIGFMDERFNMFFSDVDWCKRFKENGYKIIFNPEIKVYHIVGHSVNQKKYKMILYSHLEFFLYLQKYYKKWWQRILNIISGMLLFIGALLRIVAFFFKPKVKKVIALF